MIETKTRRGKRYFALQVTGRRWKTGEVASLLELARERGGEENSKRYI